MLARAYHGLKNEEKELNAHRQVLAILKIGSITHKSTRISIAKTTEEAKTAGTHAPLKIHAQLCICVVLAGPFAYTLWAFESRRMWRECIEFVAFNFDACSPEMQAELNIIILLLSWLSARET